MTQDLDFVADKVPSLLTVTGDDGAGHGQLYSEVQLDGGVDHGIESEDLLDSVRIPGIFSYTDSGIEIMRHLGTAEEEGIGFGGIPQNNLREDASLDYQIKPRLLQLLFDAKDLVKDARFFRIGLPQAKGNDLYFGSFDFGMDREPLRGALDPHPHVFVKRLPVRRVEAVEDLSADVIDNAEKCDTVALFFEPGATLVSGMGRKEGPIRGDDLVGDKTKHLGHLHQDMKDAVVKLLPQTFLEVGEGGLAREMIKIDSGIKAVMSSPFPIPDHLREGLHVGIFFDVAEKIQKEQTDGIVGNARHGVRMGDQGSYEGKIDEGGYKPCEPPFYSSVGMDADVPLFIAVSR